MYFPVSIADTSSIDEFTGELRNKISGLLATYSVPGAAIAIISNNQTEYVISGQADQEAGTIVTRQTGFEIASMSKSQCAFAVMKLAQDGLIDLDEPVETYLSRWSLPDSPYNNSKVTARRILSHIAGLSVSALTSGTSDRDELPVIEEALTEEGVKVIHDPGTTYSYSGGGYGILQLLIEEVTNRTYADYMTGEIFQPLGLVNTHPYASDDLANMSRGHGKFKEVRQKYYSAVVAAAGHVASVEDMATWTNSLLTGQNLLNSTTVEEMLSPAWNPVTRWRGTPWGYALGFSYYELENNRTVTGHGGDVGGYHGVYRLIRETGDAIVILTNGEWGAALESEISMKWEKIMEGKDQGEKTTWEMMWEEEKDFYARLTVTELSISLLIIIILLFGMLRGNIVIGKDKSRDQVRIQGGTWTALRWMASMMLGMFILTGLMKWNWFDSFYSRDPSNQIWIVVIPVTWMIWTAAAVLVLRLQLRDELQEEEQEVIVD